MKNRYDARVRPTIRVLLLSRPFTHLGGVRTSIEYLMEFMDKHRVEIVHVGVGKAYPESPFYRRFFEYFSSFTRVLTAIRRENPDLVHINPSLNRRSLPFHILLLMVIKLASRVPVLSHFRGWDVKIGMKLSERSLTGRVLARVIKHSDRIIVLANDFKAVFATAGVDPGKISVLPEMVDTREYELSQARDFRSNRKPQLLFISRLIAVKGVWESIGAVEWLHKTYPGLDVRLVIAGEGEELPEIEREISEKFSKQEVIALGRVSGDKKTQIFLESDILLFPSRHPEGFPIVIIEALAAGLGLIYTPVGALREELSEQNGICLALEDLDSKKIGEAVHTLFQDKEMIASISKTNRALAKQKYDVRVVCPQIEKIYESMVIRMSL